jgi:hypothetical protein
VNISRRAWAIAALPVLAVGTCYAGSRLDAVALARAGYTSGSGSPTEFFGARATEGLTPAQVAQRMPTPAEVERYVAPTSNGDSTLLERYIYRFGPGSWPVYIYYRRGGGVVDVYAQDVPSMAGTRRVSAAEAEQWRRGPRSAATVTPAGPSVVREAITARVGSTNERWALVWRHAPAPACGPEDAARASTCPCEGFAYGEQGELDLVRHVPGRAEERLALTPLFREGENPAEAEGLAVLQRWPVESSDHDAPDSATLAAEVRARPVARTMVLGDYDHDGRATELLVQVGTAPCGRRESMLVGVSVTRPTLHAFSSVAHPTRPLVLERRIWALLLGPARKFTSVEIQCGDHGAETRTEVALQVGPSGIDGTRAEYECTIGGARGRLVRSERL